MPKKHESTVYFDKGTLLKLNFTTTSSLFQLHTFDHKYRVLIAAKFTLMTALQVINRKSAYRLEYAPLNRGRLSVITQSVQ
ncbi:hypothetical protein TW84_12120 [Vibrio neptunius]|nr:hypothetical protein TW84_12120 [Vibrio neptunius]